MYDGQHDEYVNLPVLLSLGAIPIAVVSGVVYTTALRAMGWVKLTFQSKIIPTILTLTIGILLVAKWGILGANLAALMNAGVTMFLLWWYFRQRLQSNEVSPLIANKKKTSENLNEVPASND
jgi:O-antigen/teichoic acid export membrane protein